MGMGICENCPLVTILDTAEEMLDIRPSSEQDLALGFIAVTREAHQKIADRNECGGRVKDQNQSWDCPLRMPASSARSFAYLGLRAHEFTINFAKVAKNVNSNTRIIDQDNIYRQI